MRRTRVCARSGLRLKSLCVVAPPGGSDHPLSVVRTLATHEIVRAAFPRPVTERDEVGMATGKAIDGALAQASYEFRQGRRPTAESMNRRGREILDEELTDADLQLSPEDRARVLAEISGTVQAFRRSELFGLPRPRTRMILINERAGVYAQPDYWDGRDRFFEMKSYRAEPVPPDVRLQLDLFRLAFPGFRAFLACFDRHAAPVTTHVGELPRLTREESEAVLTLALRTCTELGQEKVLEYVDSPIVRYTVSA